jgi:hypothetical protein
LAGRGRKHRQKQLRRLKRISFGDGSAARAAARCIRALATKIEQLNTRVAELEVSPRSVTSSSEAM